MREEARDTDARAPTHKKAKHLLLLNILENEEPFGWGLVLGLVFILMQVMRRRMGEMNEG